MYTALLAIVVVTLKYFSLGDILLNLHVTCNNILCLGGFNASLFNTAFLSLKGQFHEIVILIALLTIFYMGLLCTC